MSIYTEDRIEAMRLGHGLYQICFRNAGVGLMFYEGAYSYEGMFPENWRDNLVVHSYYPTLEEAVDAEYERLDLNG